MATATYIAAVRNKHDGEVHYIKSTNSFSNTWTQRIDEAVHFEQESNAEKSIAYTASWLYDKKVGTKMQVSAWVLEGKNMERMKKLQDEVNANVKRLADCTLSPALFINEEANTVTFKVGGKLPEREWDFSQKPAGDPILALVETYIEKAQKIEEEGADEFTWRGFLHAFLRDVTEVAK